MAIVSTRPIFRKPRGSFATLPRRKDLYFEDFKKVDDY